MLSKKALQTKSEVEQSLSNTGDGLKKAFANAKEEYKARMEEYDKKNM